MKTSLCLNMIVRNEAARIERCLKSVAPYISSAVIYDTGSTDGTPECMEAFFASRGLPCLVVRGEFVNFEQARNAAIDAAKDAPFSYDYLLLCDADMELVVTDVEVFDNLELTGPSYLVKQRAGGILYDNVRFVRAGSGARYIGCTHEYIDVPHGGWVESVYFLDHADGSNRKEKYKRDIRLLVADLQHDPNNGRSWFYLGQSYRECHQWWQAMVCYMRRIEIGGWDEELWNSQFNIAHCWKNLGNEGEFIRNLLLAYNMRPSRAETLYDLAHHFRHKGWNAPAALFAEIGLKIPKSRDSLFVNEFAYDVGLKEEFSIAGFYDPRTKDAAFRVCDDLSLVRGDYAWQRNGARSNLFHYLPTLSRLAPSFTPHRIGFTPPDGYTPMNPSIAARGMELCCVVRTVNYIINEGGGYEIKGGDGSVNNSNPIHTRNFLCKLDDQGHAHTSREIIYADDYPVKYGLVRGFEDMRLIPRGHDLLINACVREFDEDGMCVQTLAQIGKDHTLRNIKPIRRTPRQYEKNWMPILDHEWDRNPLKFMYRLNHVVDEHGADVVIHPSHVDAGHVSGGSQVIPFFGGWLALVHEAMQFQHDYARRYYQHRFAYFNPDFSLRGLSLPFVFFDRQIEFAAGLCQRGEFDLYISFGVRDCEAWIARLDATDVMEMEQCRR